MPLYAITCRDKPGMVETRVATRPVHLDYLNAPGSPVRAAGALRDETDQPIGSIIVIEAASAAEARAFAEGDPFFKAGIFATVEVAKWVIAIGGLVEPG